MHMYSLPSYDQFLESPDFICDVPGVYSRGRQSILEIRKINRAVSLDDWTQESIQVLSQKKFCILFDILVRNIYEMNIYFLENIYEKKIYIFRGSFLKTFYISLGKILVHIVTNILLKRCLLSILILLRKEFSLPNCQPLEECKV